MYVNNSSSYKTVQLYGLDAECLKSWTYLIIHRATSNLSISAATSEQVTNQPTNQQTNQPYNWPTNQPNN